MIFSRLHICQECRVAYAPRKEMGVFKMFQDYCPTHRQPLIDAYLRKEAVLSWAESHIEVIEPLMKAEEEQRRMDYNLHAQTPLTSPAQSSDYHGLGAAGSGLQPPYGRAK